MDPSSGRNPAPGLTLKHYRLIERIGAGGMGEVWRAHDQRLERDVALKLLLPGTLGDDAARKRFRREALSLSKLAHPNIATVFDFDTEGGLDFLVMEYVAGPAVIERLAQGALPEAEVARLGVQLAEGLAAAHAQGIVHRDLKPGNVRLTPDGRLKILDFGLAKLVRPIEGRSLAESLTESQALVGTLAYMAPEQVRGEAADARSDLWAAGLVLYELATGVPAYAEARSAQVLYAILNQTPAAPRTVSREVSAGLEAIVLKCLEKEPGRRYQAATELAADLTRLLGGLTVEAERQRVHSRRVRALGIAIPVAIVLALAGLTALNVGGLRARLFAPAPIRSIAVLPLVNLSGDPGQEYFADGMTDELINGLARIRSLKVIARGSVMVYKGTSKTLRQIARDLGVDALVEGSVSRAGERVRVRAQLARGSTGENLWADSYERELRDVLALQSEVARAIVDKVQARLAPGEEQMGATARPVDPEAYQEYLKGRQAWDAYNVEGFQKAERHFRRALEIDPTNAPAWAGLADALYGCSSVFTPPNIAMPATRAAAQRALEYDPESVEGLTSLGIVKFVYEWDWAGAEASFRRALELRPNDANAHWWLGHLLIVLGRGDEGLAEGRKALDLNPLSTWYMASHGWHMRLAGRGQEAVQFLRDAAQVHPDEYILHVALGQALEQVGDFAGAIAELERAVAMDENNDDLAQLGHAYGAAGRRDDAHRLLARLRERQKTRFVPGSSFAIVYAGLKDVDQTLTWLETTLEDHSEHLLFLNVDWYYDFLKSEPRFLAVRKRVGLDR